MSWKAPLGRIVHNTSAGKTVGADIRRFGDEILVAKDVDASLPQCYPIKAGKYEGKTICVNRFKATQFDKH